jgi:hypothetical protein
MSTTLRRRLEHLELQHQGSMDEVQQAALQGISDEDLHTIHAFLGRGAPLSAPTQEEQAALARYGAECQAAALRIRGQQPSRLRRR